MKNRDSEDVTIDSEAKLKIDLKKIEKDKNGNPYFIGKLQAPGMFFFEHGASFMVFKSKEGREQLHISPLDPSRIHKGSDDAHLNKGRLSIDLYPMLDKNNEEYFIGEACGPVMMDLRRGVFFTAFLSIEDEETLQLSPLDHEKTRRRKARYDDVPIEHVDSYRDRVISRLEDSMYD